jgi:hypothetical protein
MQPNELKPLLAVCYGKRAPRLRPVDPRRQTNASGCSSGRCAG